MTPSEKKNIYNQLTELKQGLSRVLFILESDQTTNSKGLVETVRNIEQDIDEIKTQNKVDKARIATYGVFGGAFLVALYGL